MSPHLQDGTTIAQARRILRDAFSAAGIESPDADARILVGAALSLDHAKLAAESASTIPPQNARTIESYAARRLDGEPVSRILGIKEFWSLPLFVTAAVLVPRPDTETVVETALDIVLRIRAERLRVLDIGTGSGALLLALLSELPNAVGVGTDISFAAADVARGNARRLGFGSRSNFVVDDMAQSLSGPFDLIVSNPPYIRAKDIAVLPREVRDHDPHLALDGGPDGLAAYRALAAAAGRLLADGGTLVLELGAGQERAVAEILKGAGLHAQGPARPDLAGIPRALAARKLARTPVPPGPEPRSGRFL